MQVEERLGIAAENPRLVGFGQGRVVRHAAADLLFAEGKGESEPSITRSLPMTSTSNCRAPGSNTAESTKKRLT